MKKNILLYSLILGILLILMKTLEYRYLYRRLGIEIYLGLVAIVCLAVGVWLGYQLIKKKSAHPTQIDFIKASRIQISERESEVLQLMATGLSNQEIADQLFISVHTVKTHSSNLFGKLDVKRRTQAIVRAKELGILQD